MGAIAYYLSLPLLYLISILPAPLLYAVSDFICFILYRLLRYRKKIVRENLCNSFPEKSEDELKLIEKKFYHYLCDLFLETFKTLNSSEKFVKEHCTFSSEAQKLFDEYYEKKKSIIIVMGHFGNWEWAGNSFSLLCRQQLLVIYHPLANNYFNDMIIRMRLRFGTRLIPMKDTFKEMLKVKSDVTATAFIADQTPNPENALWTTFLHQETPVFRGTETIARKLNYPVVYASVNRLKRGFYQITAETLFNNPSETKNDEITEAHTRKLEQEILAQPEIWLWSHRRWKHKKPEALDKQEQ